MRKLDCVVCGTSFDYTRSTAKFCSNKCKQENKNRSKRMKRYELTLQSNIEHLIRELSRYQPDKMPYIAALVHELSAKPNDRMYKCRECGQLWFGDQPPTSCSFCQPTHPARSYWDVVY